ncbi:MAG: DUF357 domain-containing protein [Candidatus Anstonellales archaeon]
MRTRRALEKLRLLIDYSSNKVDQKILNRAKDYYKDAIYFISKRRYYDAIAAIDYAYGLLEGALLQQNIDTSNFY